MSSKIPVYRYEITLTDGQQRTADAITYREYEEWLLFDDVRATVFQVRREKVDEIRRSAEAIGEQLVDELSDRAPVGH